MEFEFSGSKEKLHAKDGTVKTQTLCDRHSRLGCCQHTVINASVFYPKSKQKTENADYNTKLFFVFVHNTIFMLWGPGTTVR